MNFRASFKASLAAAVLCMSVRGQEIKSPPANVPANVHINRLLVVLAPAAPAERTVRYPLLPDPLDLKPGNAAPLWLHAGLLIKENAPKIKSDEYLAMIYPTPEQAAKQTPKAIREFLDHFGPSLRLADQAARCASCDWGRPAITVENTNDVVPLPQVQLCRELASLLGCRYRLELAEKRFDKAIYTLQTGLTLGRHVAIGGSLLEYLVGNAIASVQFGKVEDWMRTPGAPDLYWSLTELPSPFLELRPIIAYELNTIYRSYPSLRRLNLMRSNERLTAAEVDRLADDFFTTLNKWQDDKKSAWSDKIAGSVLVMSSLAGAKKYLRERGWSDERLNATPALAIVVSSFLGQYDEACDDALKWMSVPAWQGRDELERVVKKATDAAKTNRNPLVVLMFPAATKSYQTWLRMERKIATLRTAEAIRIYAAAHGGKPPAKLSDITAVPLPIDPATGKGFDDDYSVKDGTGVLEVNPLFWSWRYELPPAI
jgi:hypothetical protein